MSDQRLIEQVKHTASAMTALETGSPQALADCKRRQRDAQKAAQKALGTYVPSARSLEWAENERQYEADERNEPPDDDYEAGVI